MTTKRCSIARAVSLLLLWLVPGIVLAADTLRIVLTGDVLLDRGVRQRVERTGGVDCLFSRGIDSLFRQADIVVGNLECPATHIQAPVFKRFVFRAEPEWLQGLRRHGFTHLNLANNHSIDQGRAGLLDTRENIIRYGMVPLGAGATQKEASAPVLLADGERKVWMLASLRLPLENTPYLPKLPSVSQEPFDTLVSRVAMIRQQDPKAYIIVSLHWGWEHHERVLPRQREQAHRLIDAGADILVCHHPHVLQPAENYRGHMIYYSVGNFIFDQRRLRNSLACVVQINITGQESIVKSLLVKIENCRVRLVDK
ncbi:CapA family protein [Prevotella sp. KH2C16]|uniref:CapA family protein n=1 Tax=Prevotella sp. KH2C16 TaxID=1855325 RepID=UPI0008DEDF2A|nr:CapA family protein [Prevotella sp. KH2C16]SFG33189.1 poly-gamma-glutamate synthesis protein (capsule biosynthesis protein) [Prevotella sp. KH2C16]